MVPLHRCELRQGSAAKFTPASYLSTSLPAYGVLGLVSSISLPSEELTHQFFALQHAHSLARLAHQNIIAISDCCGDGSRSQDGSSSPLPGDRHSFWYDLGDC